MASRGFTLRGQAATSQLFAAVGEVYHPKALHTGIYRPKSLILLVFPSQRQSQELFRKVKEAYEHMDAKPGLIEDNKLSMVLSNGSRLVSLPIRGFPA